MLFDEINHIMSLINENQNRKRIVSMKYVFQRIFSMLNIECKHTTIKSNNGAPWVRKFSNL